jgi:hypothetical protein
VSGGPPRRVPAAAREDYTFPGVSEFTISTVAIDTHRLLRALKSTGKSANFTAEEIADAVDVAQEGGEWVTRSHFDAKIDAMCADIKAEVKASQMQNFLWLSGIMLVSNGAVIAVLARAARLY